MKDHPKSNDSNAKSWGKKKEKQLLKEKLKANGNQNVSEKRALKDNKNSSDGNGENEPRRKKRVLKEAASVEENMEIEEMSPTVEKNLGLGDGSAKRPKNKRTKGLLKECNKAVEEQEGNEESISELNPRSIYGSTDNGLKTTENLLLKETDKSEAESKEGMPEASNEKSENRKRKRKQLLLEEAAKADQRGVCYLSRIPPHMDPVNLRQILSQYGEIRRIYLSPEEYAARVPRKRVKGKRDGGFQAQTFSEGWVEFTKKSVAKRVANMLNGEQIGGRKRSSFYYDLWNIKYLSKFKWDDLTEEIAYKNAIREQKLALEISAAKRERDFYLSKVDQSRALSSIEERIKKKQKQQQESGTNSEFSVSQQVKKVFRQFPQKQPVADNKAKSKPRLSKDILAGVFGGS